MKTFWYPCVSFLGVLLMVSAGCSSFPENVGSELVTVNRQHLRELRVGMTQAEVLTIMGGPQQTASYPRYAKHLQYWKYQTSERPAWKFAEADEHYTFLAFEGDVLVARGASHEVIPFSKKHPLWKPQ